MPLQKTWLPPPFAGQRDDIPTIAIESPNAQLIQNFNLQLGSMRLRFGDKFHLRTTSGASDLVANITNYGDTKLIAVVADGSTTKWYDVTTAVSLLHSEATSTNPVASVNFGANTYFFSGTNWTLGGVYYDGTTWANGPYTFTPYTTMSPFLGTPHKNRLYLLDLGSLNFGYSPIDALTGVMQTVDLSTVVKRVPQAAVKWVGISSLQISDNLSSKSFLCYITKLGEILVYDGSYPGSSDWSLVGQFILPPLIPGAGPIDYLGDVLLLTTLGVVSLRQLFVEGLQKALDNSFSKTIPQRWRQIVGTGAAMTGFYDIINNRLVLRSSIYITQAGSTSNNRAFFLIYDFTVGAWYEHVSSIPYGIEWISFFQNQIYYAIGHETRIYKKEGRTDFVDATWNSTDQTTTTPYDWSIKSAPLPTDRSFNTKLNGLEFLVKGSFYTASTFELIGDLGVQTSGLSTLPDQGTSLRKPYVGVGINSTMVQYEIDNIASTGPGSSGFEFYGLNMIFQQGQGR